MIIDAQTQLASAQALTATGLSSNAYDLGAAFSGGSANGDARDPTVGEPMAIIIVPTVAADVASADETYTFQFVQSANANLSSADVLATYPFTNAQAASALLAGKVVVFALPPGAVTKRYVGLNVVLAGTTPSITYSAWIAPLSMVQKQKFYPTAIVIN